MKSIWALIAFLPFLAAWEDAPDEDPLKEIAILLNQLGAPSLEEREKATNRLKSIGLPALPALKRALEERDPEIQFRARSIIDEIIRSDRLATVCPPCPPITLDHRDVSLELLAADLSEKALTRVSCGAETLKKMTVSLRAKGLPLMAVLDRLCRSRETLSYEWTDDGNILLKEGEYERSPFACRGSFALRISWIRTSRMRDGNHSEGSFTLAITPEHDRRLSPRGRPLLEITEVQDDQERPLVPSRPPTIRQLEVRNVLMNRTTSGSFQFHFPELPADARSLSIVRGKVVHFFPLEDEEASIRDPIESPSVEIAGLRITFDNEKTLSLGDDELTLIGLTVEPVRPGTSLSAAGMDAILPAESIVVVDKNGKEHRKKEGPVEERRVLRYAAMARLMERLSDGKDKQFCLLDEKIPPEAINEIRFRIVTDFHGEEVKFEFRNVDLP